MCDYLVGPSWDLRIDFVVYPLTLAAWANDAIVSQNGQMLRCFWLRYFKGCDDRAHTNFAFKMQQSDYS